MSEQEGAAGNGALIDSLMISEGAMQVDRRDRHMNMLHEQWNTARVLRVVMSFFLTLLRGNLMPFVQWMTDRRGGERRGGAGE